MASKKQLDYGVEPPFGQHVLKYKEKCTHFGTDCTLWRAPPSPLEFGVIFCNYKK